ncbi:MAG: hypothetical protein RR847_01860 [Bacilli bacterium]
MGEGTAELYATKMYWKLQKNSSEAKETTRKRTFYDEEVIALKK